jgi:hypothetical protein
MLAAFGQHALAGRLEPRMLAAFATGAQYQITHALAIGLAALAARGAAQKLAERAALLFFAGILLFFRLALRLGAERDARPCFHHTLGRVGADRGLDRAGAGRA